MIHTIQKTMAKENPIMVTNIKRNTKISKETKTKTEIQSYQKL